MQTNAKLGDQLGKDFWTAKSKYGATIQNALDYTMSKNPGKEDVDDILPHVAAVAAAYGDPTKKYATFLQKTAPAYRTLPFYYYDQTKALMKAPSSKSGGKRDSNPEEVPESALNATLTTAPSMSAPPEEPSASSVASTNFPTPTIAFTCPPIFSLVDNVQLDDGVFVTCQQLKPFFGYA